MIKGIDNYIRSMDKPFAKNNMSKKRREIEKQGLKDIKREFNNGYAIKELSIDEIIKDRRYIKNKSRRKGINFLVERRCSGGRLAAKFLLI